MQRSQSTGTLSASTPSLTRTDSEYSESMPLLRIPGFHRRGTAREIPKMESAAGPQNEEIYVHLSPVMVQVQIDPCDDADDGTRRLHTIFSQTCHAQQYAKFLGPSMVSAMSGFDVMYDRRNCVTLVIPSRASPAPTKMHGRHVEFMDEIEAQHWEDLTGVWKKVPGKEGIRVLPEDRIGPQQFCRDINSCVSVVFPHACQWGSRRVPFPASKARRSVIGLLRSLLE